MANLFGKNKLKSVAQAVDTDSVLIFIDIVKKWHHDYHHGTLKQDKETSREQEYNQNFFKDILGYKEKPATPFNFEPKATTSGGQLPDAVVGYTDKANNIENLAAVVELKGTSIPLDRPQRREGNMSPVQQGFKYKTQYRNCPFVIVSNFYEFRLYRDNQLDYELWTLDDLVDPTDDYFLFKTWYVLLKGENFITSKGASKTEQLLSDIRIQQEDIGKKFYKVYKEARVGLLRDVYANNKHVRGDIDFGIEKAQKIIDRIVFAAFAEDRGLLPDNTLQRVVREAEQSSFGISLWQAFKGLFEAIDSGSDKLEIPGGYNGGLFKTDLELNSLKISDDALRPVIKLGNYNFSEDLSVNILGHIFEQSISDLEEIKTKVSESQNIEVLNQNRRKKDGIFYTPDYIVRYIVENSLGTYLREVEDNLKTEFKLHGDINDKTYIKREQSAYGKYQDFLQNIKVVDPACGSGAFLVYVFDYLLAENKRVGDILGNTIFSNDDYVRDILRNNIYGVDLNEESVEITKLSLWLKSAQKGKKLTALDNNIKCGNSLISDPVVAGNKALDWHKQFADIFKSGGFDVVVGNPPYVRGTQLSMGDKSFYRKYYKSAYKQYDLYVLFNELAISILKMQGRVGFIQPNKFLSSEYGNSISHIIVDSCTIEKILNVSLEKVFAEASVYPYVFIYKKRKDIGAIKNDPISIFNYVDPTNLDGFDDNIKARQLIGKIDNCSLMLGDISGSIKRGVPSSKLADESGDILAYKSTDLKYPYFTSKSTSKIKYLNEIISNEYADEFKESYIMLPRTVLKIRASLSLENTHILDRIYYFKVTDRNLFNEKFVLGILNSKLTSFYYNYLYGSTKIGGGYFDLKGVQIKKLPIPRTNKEQSDSIERLVETVIEKMSILEMNSSRFKKLLINEFSLDSLSAKLNKWWVLDFNDFVSVLKVKLSLAQKDELLGLFEKYRTELQQLDTQIQQTDQEIDQLVYDLYKLTSKEVAIIEGS